MIHFQGVLPQGGSAFGRKFCGRFRKHMKAVEVVSASLLVAIGVLMVAPKLTVLSGYLSFLNRFTL